VLELDALRRERGIFSQPTFDINGNVQGGAPRFEIFAALLDDAYEAAIP
jgi:hypothetical protein